MKGAEERLAAEVAGWMKKAAAQDAAEDRQHGGDRRGDELPDWVANKERRLAKIREAKAALEAEAQAAAGQGAGEDSEVAAKRGRKGQPPSGVPEDNAQRNFTDPESRIMKTKDGFIQGYNAQAAVDAEHQIIVSCDLTNQGTDSAQLLPLIDQIKANTEVLPKQVSADAGYASDANLKGLEEREIDGFVAAAGRSTAPRRLLQGKPRRAAGSPPWPKRLPARAMTARIGCASRRSSRCLGRSSRHAGSGNSCCAGWTRSNKNGCWSARPIICSNLQLLDEQR